MGAPHASVQRDPVQESTLVPSPEFLFNPHVQGLQHMCLALPPPVIPRKERARIIQQERKVKKRKGCADVGVGWAGLQTVLKLSCGTLGRKRSAQGLRQHCLTEVEHEPHM